MKNKQLYKRISELGIALTITSGLSCAAISKPVAPTPKHTYTLDLLQIAQSNIAISNIHKTLIEIGQLGHKERQNLSPSDVIELANILKSLKVEPSKYSTLKEQAMSYMFDNDRTNPNGVKKLFNTLVKIGVIGKNYHRVPNRYEAQKLKNILIKSGLLQNNR